MTSFTSYARWDVPVVVRDYGLKCGILKVFCWSASFLDIVMGIYVQNADANRYTDVAANTC